jgi:hypothetical protein
MRKDEAKPGSHIAENIFEVYFPSLIAGWNLL